MQFDLGRVMSDDDEAMSDNIHIAIATALQQPITSCDNKVDNCLCVTLLYVHCIGWSKMIIYLIIVRVN